MKLVYKSSRAGVLRVYRGVQATLQVVTIGHPSHEMNRSFFVSEGVGEGTTTMACDGVPRLKLFSKLDSGNLG